MWYNALALPYGTVMCLWEIMMTGIVNYVPRHSPKQTEIVGALRGRILSGHLQPGHRLPTLTELETEFGTSNLTAQRAIAHLRRSGYVVTRGRAGTFVSVNPPHLSQFAVVFPESPTSDGRWSQFYTAVRQEAASVAARLSSKGSPEMAVSFFFADLQKDRRKLLALVQTEQLAGLVFPAFPSSLGESEIMTHQSLPRVHLTWDAEPMPGTVVVRLDYDMLFDKTLRYFAERGRRNVALMVVSFRGANPGHLAEVFPEYVRKYGLTTRDYWIQGADMYCPMWARALAQLLARSAPGDRPDALLIVDDNLVQPATEGLLAAGVSVPRDMEIVGHATFPYPTPSALPIRRIGFSVTEMLAASIDVIQRLRRGEKPDLQILKPRFDDELGQSYPVPCCFLGLQSGSRTQGGA